MSKSSRAEKAVLPILDMMQTIPSFVYLIPIIMLLGIGKVPGLLAVCIYALPPVVRLTNLGIREVDKETLEASEAFGATPMQKLKSVQIPLSLPTIFAGINQTTVPITNLILLDPIQANKANIPMTIGQGLLTNNFSNQIKKYNSGSKTLSIPSP